MKKTLGLIPNREEEKDEVIEDNTPEKPKLEEIPKGVNITEFEPNNKYMQDDLIDITNDDTCDADNVANTTDNVDVFEVDVQMFDTQQE